MTQRFLVTGCSYFPDEERLWIWRTPSSLRLQTTPTSSEEPSVVEAGYGGIETCAGNERWRCEGYDVNCQKHSNGSIWWWKEPKTEAEDLEKKVQNKTWRMRHMQRSLSRSWDERKVKVKDEIYDKEELYYKKRRWTRRRRRRNTTRNKVELYRDSKKGGRNRFGLVLRSQMSSKMLVYAVPWGGAWNLSWNTHDPHMYRCEWLLT